VTFDDEFQDACEQAVRECRRLGYVPSAWISMMERYGAVEAAKRLLVSGDLQPGLLRLVRLSRPDLTIEHAVLEPRWADLFDDRDRELAEWRLTQAQAEQ
jgi:hypothetical protein